MNNTPTSKDILTLANSFRAADIEYPFAEKLDQLSDLMVLVEECRSPLEVKLFCEFAQLCNGYITSYENSEKSEWYLRPDTQNVWGKCRIEEIRPNKRITVEGHTYFLDIFILCHRFTPEGHIRDIVMFDVEVDGHDYHERTKEQASSDRERDRTLQRNGYAVIRFTGGDVFRDASRCVIDTMNAIYATGEQS